MIGKLCRKSSGNELLRSPVLSIRGITEITSIKRNCLAREKSHKGQTHPLPEAERLEELLPGMAKSRLYDIRRRDWQTHTSEWRIARWTETTAKRLRDQLTLFGHLLNWLQN